MTVKLVGADDAVGADPAANYFYLTKFTAIATGNMTEFRVKSKQGGYAKVALYADSGGEPAGLITAMGEQLVPDAGWQTLSFTSTPIISGTTYWLADCLMYAGIIQSTNATGVRRYKAATYSTFTFPNPAGSGFDSMTTYYDLVAGWGTLAVKARSLGLIIE
jgi:hypothetical protein